MDIVSRTLNNQLLDREREEVSVAGRLHATTNTDREPRQLAAPQRQGILSGSIGNSAEAMIVIR